MFVHVHGLECGQALNVSNNDGGGLECRQTVCVCEVVVQYLV